MFRERRERGEGERRVRVCVTGREGVCVVRKRVYVTTRVKEDAPVD